MSFFLLGGLLLFFAHHGFSDDQIPVNGLWEWRMLASEAGGVYENPHNVSQVLCSAAVNDLVAPGFFMVPYGDSDQPTGPGEWRVRFSPRVQGVHRVAVTLKWTAQGGGQRELYSGSFSAMPSNLPGVVAISPHNPRAFVDSTSGRDYFPAGMNVVGMYTRDAVVPTMRSWLTKLSGAGRANYVRIWTMDNVKPAFNRSRPAPYQLALETGPVLGWYDQLHAYNLDQVLQMAEQLGLRALLCLIDQHSYRRTRRWPVNQFNVANGGWLSEPQQFLTDHRAKALFKQRAHYIVARYGWSSSIFAYQFWNEIDFIDGYDADVARAWHQEMMPFMRELDRPNRHLLTTSMAREFGSYPVESLLDFVTTHHYANATFSFDMAAAISGLCQLKQAWYPEKPHFIGEFGVSPKPLELNFFRAWHNGLWAAVTSSGCSATAMAWFWTAVAQMDKWHMLAPVAQVARRFDWSRHRRSPVQLLVVEQPSLASSCTSQQQHGFALRGFATMGRRFDNAHEAADGVILLAWLQSAHTTWHANLTLPLVPANAATVQLMGLDGGTYMGEWLDTRTGSSLGHARVACDSGICNPFPVTVAFTGDVALALQRIALPPQK